MFYPRSIPDPPPSVYESWPAPNYVDPVTRGPGLTVTNSICLPLVVVVVAARCYTRIKITGSFGLDDVLIVAATLSGVGLMSVEIVTDSVYNWNRHVWDMTADDIRGGLQLEVAAALLFIWSAVLTKLSVIWFCRRLLSPSHPCWYKWVLNGTAVFTLFACVLYTTIFCLACQPLSAYWDHTAPTWEPDYPYHCLNIYQLWMSGTILNVLADAMVWFIPLPLVFRLHLPMRQRLLVMALFALGAVVVAVSTLKSIFLHQTFDHTYDVTWVGWPTWICGALEIALGILCASAPALRPFFSHFFPHPASVFANRHSYVEMSHSKEARDPYNQMGGDMSMEPMSPNHRRAGSIGSGTTGNSGDDMKPWAYSTRTSSRAASRRGSLGKLDTNLAVPRPLSQNTTPASLTPGSPVGRRLAPVREIDQISGAANLDFKFNQTAALPQCDEEHFNSDGATNQTTDAGRKSPMSPEKLASPLWWKSRPGTGRRPRTNSFGTNDRNGSVSTINTERSRKNSATATDWTDLKRTGSVKSDGLGPAQKPSSPLKKAIHSDASLDQSIPKLRGEYIPALSDPTASSSAKRHLHKPSSSREFETFNFDIQPAIPNPASLSAQDPQAELAPPPSYGEFVENNSWICDDRTVGRSSVDGSQTSDNDDAHPRGPLSSNPT